LIPENEIIESYNETFRDKSISERKEWSLKVLKDLQSKFSLRDDEFLILAGTVYNEYLLEHINKYELPLKGKKLGQWISALKILLKKESDGGVSSDNYCFLVHQIFNKMPV
jgi:hypothetical protein